MMPIKRLRRRGCGYVVFNVIIDYPLFNEVTQTQFFPTIKACRRAIEEDLDGVEAINMDTNEIVTPRSEGATEQDYAIFREVKGGRLRC